MAKIKISVGADAIEQAQESGEFVEAPVGVYLGVLKSIEHGYPKGDDGKPDKSRSPRFECIYTLKANRDGSDLEQRYSQVWDYVSFSEAAEWKMAQFALAMGLPIKNGKIDAAIETEPNKPGTVVGTEVLVRVKADKDLEGNYRAKVGAVLPADGGTAADTEAGLFDDGDAEPEGDVENPFDEDIEPEEDGEDLLLTEEDLEAMDLKELAGIAGDFDLDPKESIVKVRGKVNNAKTKAALIEAILEAQGDDGDEDDEEPF